MVFLLRAKIKVAKPRLNQLYQLKEEMKTPGRHLKQENKKQKAGSNKLPSIRIFGVSFWEIASCLLPVLILFFWLQKIVKPELIYHQQAGEFFFDATFIKEYISRPGGITEYIALFLIQFFDFGWIGSILEVALSIVICVLVLFILRKFDRATWTEFIFLFCAPMILLHLNYTGNPMLVKLTLIVGLLLSCVYLLISRVDFLKFVYLFFFIPLIFWVSPCGLLIFLTLVLVSEIWQKKFWNAVIVLVICFGYFIFGSVSETVKGNHFLLYEGSKNPNNFIAYLFMIWVPVFIIARVISLKLYEHFNKNKILARLQILEKPTIRFPVVIILCIFCLFIANRHFDFNRKYLIEVDYFGTHRQWGKVLDSFSKLKLFNGTSIIQVHRALYFEGKLLDDMFSYPHFRERDFFPEFSEGIEVCTALAENLFELGQPNLAEHMAHEALESEGARPRILTLLARINLVKGTHEVAKIFLRRLSLNPFYRSYANRMVRMIENNSITELDPEVAELIKFKSAIHYAGSGIRDETLLIQLLQTNPGNRMAFEYYIATLLKNKKLTEVTRLIPRVGYFGRAELPRHVEEAVLVWKNMENHYDYTPGNFKINDETVLKFQQFTEILKRYNGNLDMARSALAFGFGTTYWYYYLYGECFNPDLGAYKILLK